MNIHKWFRSKQFKYIKIIFLILWCLSIFTRGILVDILMILAGVYAILDYKQLGIENKNFQDKIGYHGSIFSFQISMIIVGLFFCIVGISLFINDLALLLKNLLL